MTQWQSPACHASNPGRRISYLCQLLRNRRCESFSPAKDGLRQACRRTGRGRCPRADLHSAPGRSGHQACRHYDRRARCFAGSGQPVGGVNPAPWTVSPTKPGPDCALGTTNSLGQEPWWNAGRRARPTAEGGASRFFVARPAPAGAGGSTLRLPAFRFLISSSLRGANGSGPKWPAR